MPWKTFWFPLCILITVFWHQFLWFNPILTLLRLSKDSTSWSHNLTRMPHFRHPSPVSGVWKLLVPLQAQPQVQNVPTLSLIDNSMGWFTEFHVTLFVITISLQRVQTIDQVRGERSRGSWAPELVSIEWPCALPPCVDRFISQKTPRISVWSFYMSYIV